MGVIWLRVMVIADLLLRVHTVPSEASIIILSLPYVAAGTVMKKEVKVSVFSATGVAQTKAVPLVPDVSTAASSLTVKRPLIGLGSEGSLSTRDMVLTLFSPFRLS